MIIKVNKDIIEEVWREFQMPPPVIEGDVVEIETTCSRGSCKSLYRAIVLGRILEKMDESNI